MKKILLAIAIVAATVTTLDARRIPNYGATYAVRATAVAWSDGPTCSAAARMLHDRHRIVYRGNDVYVNGMRWTIRGSMPGHAVLAFHDKPRQLTYLTMEIETNDRQLIGQYTLYGVLPNRKFCADRVEIRGDRI